jgi:Ser/Thr protein kinase RdoA (MazF antagonist)
MKPFKELTERGQLRRLRKMVVELLRAYDFEVAKLSFLTIETNTYFKVATTDGRKYALRIYSDDETNIHDNRAEVFWLDALMRDTDIRATRPVARKDGEYISVVNRSGLPPDRRCVLYEWVPGTQLGCRLSPEKYHKLGQIMAGLHDHAESLNRPDDIRPKRWDQVFYYLKEPVVIFDEGYKGVFNTNRRRIMKKAIARCTEHLDQLYGDDREPILVHGDLHFNNVHVHNGQFHIIDFEDVSLGHPVQDIAVTLYYGRDRDDYLELRAAFKEGYTSRRAWPETIPGLIESQMAARAIMFTNYVARIRKDPEEFVDAKCRQLADFLETGKMWIGKM